MTLLAAKTADLASLADFVGQAKRNQPKQRVARRMAERVVDSLEPVEIEQEHGAAMLPPNGADQSIVKRPAKGLSVGQAGQGILTRQPVQLDFRLPHLGKV
jgi:hypothetical protein